MTQRLLSVVVYCKTRYDLSISACIQGIAIDIVHGPLDSEVQSIAQECAPVG